MYDNVVPPIVSILLLVSTLSASSAAARSIGCLATFFQMAPAGFVGSERSPKPSRNRVRRTGFPRYRVFLRARAVELVPGGKLLLQVFGSSDAKRCCDGVYDVLNDAVLEVLNHGMIDRAAYDAYYQPVYFRTLDETLTEPGGTLFLAISH